MDLQDINHLLAKYEAGKTTLLEEQQLSHWFLNTKDIPQNLKSYKQLFSFYDKEQQLKAPQQEMQKGRTRHKWWMAAASAVILALAVWYGNSTTNNDLGTYEDPKVAFYKTKDILNTVSIYLNEGVDELAYLKELNTTKNKLVHDN